MEGVGVKMMTLSFLFLEAPFFGEPHSHEEVCNEAEMLTE